MLPASSPRRLQGRVLVAVGVSLAMHASVGFLAFRRRAGAPVQPASEAPVELTVVDQPAPIATPERPPAPEPAPGAPRSKRGSTRPVVAARPADPGEPAPETPTAGPAPNTHPLMQMRDHAVQLTPDDDLLARALGPAETPPAPQQPPRRKPRLPGTGLTTLVPEIDQTVRLVHPRYFDVLSRVEHTFRPDHQRLTDEVRGDLSAEKTMKRWLLGGVGGDVDAMRNQVPTLACLVCVTLRPSQPPTIELAGASGSAWFDRTATASLEQAAISRDGDDDGFDAARACYRFAAKVWRTRPDLTNLAVPFKLNFESTVRLVSYQKLESATVR